jgi:hypothetical protein
MMKILFKSLVWLFLFTFNNVNSQSLGFVQSECGIISNPHYWYENYQQGSHGYGFNLYHDGKIILDGYEQLGLVWGQEMEFIDDTTGFFICFDDRASLISVYKIINDNANRIGDLPGLYNYFDFFTVSKYSVLLVSHPAIGYLYIGQFSDLKPGKIFAYDTITNSDTTYIDTIEGITLCPGLNELNYLYFNSPDTLKYTFKFKIDSLAVINECNDLVYKIIPNPANDFICVNGPLNKGHITISIYDNLSRLRKIQNLTSDVKQEIYIGDLEPGQYFVIIDNSTIRKVYKIIKV